MPLDNPGDLGLDPENIQTFMDVIEALELSPGSLAQLTTFVERLTEKGKPQFKSFLTYVLKFIEYNRSRYLQLQFDLTEVSQELQSLKSDLRNLLVAFRNVNATATADAAQVPFVAQPVSRVSDASQMPFVAPPASRPPASSVTDSTLTINVDGTVSRKMD